MAHGFRGKHGRIMLRESVNVAAADRPGPMQDWRPQDVIPNLSKSVTRKTLAAARDRIDMAFGVLPGLTAPATTGPMIREAQRHLAQWTLQPIAAQMADEASSKLGQRVLLDVMRPLQAFDAGGRARALTAVVQAMATAEESGLSEGKFADVLRLVDWDSNLADG